MTVGFPPLIHIGESADVFDKRNKKQNKKYDTELKGRIKFLIRRKLNIIGQSCMLHNLLLRHQGIGNHKMLFEVILLFTMGHG